MTRCALTSSDEPTDATAPFADTWLVVEHPGPWSGHALQSPSLDPTLAEHLGSLVGDGVRVLLARHPDRPTRSHLATRRVWLARTATRPAELLVGEVDDLAAILEWTRDDVRHGQVPGMVYDHDTPLVLVCTNGRRDACCAVEGRALMTALLECSGHLRDRIWECSHVGGHRFAPVTLTLPHGIVHGRIPIADVESFWEHTREGHVTIDRLRGITRDHPVEQAADLAVRRMAEVSTIDDLDAVEQTPGEVLVTHRDGRRWHVRVTASTLDVMRPESCGAEPSQARTWHADALEID